MHLNFKIRICTVLAEYSPWISEARSVGFGSLPLLSKRVSPLWRVPGNDTMNEKHHWQTRLSTRACLQKKARNTTFQLYVNHFVRPLVQSVSSKESLSAYCMPFPLPNPRAFTRWSMGLPWRCSGWDSACRCRPHGLDSWSGKIARAAEQRSPGVTTTEACEPKARASRQEKPLRWGACKQRSPLATARESPRKSQPRPSTAKKNK